MTPEQIANELKEAGHLLDDVLPHLPESHPLDCARNRDDFDCTCGLDDIRDRIKEWLVRA